MTTTCVAAIAMAAVLGLSCGEREASVSLPPAPQAWQELSDTLPPAVNLGSPNICGRGDEACVTAIVGEMKRRLRTLIAACDHNAAFALLYLDVTRSVPDTPFVSRRFFNHLDAVFARLYFRSFDAWYEGRRAQVPEVWRVTFEAADKRSVTGLGDMLLGMNAHISRDLTFALVDTGLETPDGRSAEPDYNAVNRLLIGLADRIVRDVSGRLDPTVGEQALPLTGTGLLNLGQLFVQWRGEAWQNAVRILEARGAERRRLEQAVDELAAGRARLIESLTSNLVVGPGAEARERFCRR